MSIEIRRINDDAELVAALALRQQVFCVEQGVPRREELSSQDHQALHLVAVSSQSQVLGTCRLIFEHGTARLGRLAVDPQVRREGVATRLLEEAERQAREAGAQRIILNAQTRARELYTAAGYQERDQTFVEVGIEHIAMEKSLA